LNRQQINYILIGAGAVLLLVLYGRFAYAPLARHLAERKLELAQSQKALEEVRGISEHYEEYADRAERVRLERERLADQLPDQARVADLLKDVTRVAGECNIKNFQFVPQTALVRPEVVRFPVRLTVTCSYHALGLFISKLAALPRLVNTSNIQINGKDKTGKTDSIKVDMLLETYVQSRH
jgi:type IV pilus assembly protein PilO